MKISSKLNRNPEENCMISGRNYRKKVEYSKAFENLKSEENNFGKRLFFFSHNSNISRIKYIYIHIC